MRIRSLAAELLPTALQGWQRVTFSAAPAADPSADTESFDLLTARLGYLSRAGMRQVREAYKFADEAHLGQFRASGQPYITHPLAVAGICAEWRLDVQAIMAALLHDAIEDRGVRKDELVERFGAPTADLVDGLTKLDKLHFHTREEGQAESFRKMLLAMSRDVRVILVKLADRLHNMRTLAPVAPDKRQRIARETLDIYAPIAHRLGLNEVYRELQELAFEHLHPWRHAALAKAVQRTRGVRRDVVARIQREVLQAFGQHKIRIQLGGREKTICSIYRKMRHKRDGFATVSDIHGFRVLVGSLDECYRALGVLHQLYKPVPGRFKDYIAIPKVNAYQSLHTTLVGPLGTPIEFQVRTEEMHAVAEKGIAAHWLYKLGDKGRADEAQGLGTMWLQSLLEIQNETPNATEFLEHVKIDLYPDAIYVFTPRSRILALPRGATPVDFAYAIHSDVGDHTLAANVNGESVSLRTELKSGDRVEVITGPGGRPNPSWLSFVRTGRARSKIRHYLNTLAHEESEALGEKMLAQALRAEGLAMPSTDPADEPAAAQWQQLTRWSGNRGRGELLIDICAGRKVAIIVAKRLATMMIEHGARPDAVTLSMGRFGADDTSPRQGMVFVDGSVDAPIRLAPCCRPIPGDAIVGYLGRGEGLLVHTAECRVGKRLFERDSERWIQVAWADELTRSFVTSVVTLVSDGKGVLAQLASAVSATEADINHLDMGSERAEGATELRLLVSVRDRQHLADVLRRLRRVPAVLKVSRGKP